MLKDRINRGTKIDEATFNTVIASQPFQHETGPREPRPKDQTKRTQSAMAGLQKKIETLMSAITFAEEGEFETAKAMMKTRKRVLLALRNNRIDRKTCTYAMNTCTRIGIDLDILLVGNDTEEPLASTLHPFLEQLKAASISYKLSQKTGCLKQAILDHIDEGDNILFVVIESQGSLDSNCAKDRHLTDTWQKLQCPLVVVAEGLKA